MALLRLNKYLAENAGVSRREADRLIESGRVLVNGSVASVGLRIDDTTDRVQLDDKPVVKRRISHFYAVNKPAIGEYMPDVTFLLDLPAEVGIARKKNQAELDRMEQESIDFHKKVAEGYRTLAARDPERILKVDATLPIDTICDMIKGRVNELLAR